MTNMINKVIPMINKVMLIASALNGPADLLSFRFDNDKLQLIVYI